MIRLDTLTKVKPTKVGMTYSEWSASYQDALGVPYTEKRMKDRNAERGRVTQRWTEDNVASAGMEGWGNNQDTLNNPYGPSMKCWNIQYSRKEKWKAV